MLNGHPRIGDRSPPKSNGGQIVATMNLDREGLERELGGQYAKAIIRRICGEPKGILIDFSRGTIQKDLRA